MVLKKDEEELNIVLKFRIGRFDYVVFATTETIKCFSCRTQGHLVRSCPEWAAGAWAGSGHAGLAQAGVSQLETPPAAAPQGEGANGSDQHKRDWIMEQTEEVNPSESKCSTGGDKDCMEIGEIGQSEAVKDKEPAFKRPF